MTEPLPVTVSVLLRSAEESLRGAGIPTPRLDAEALLAAVLSTDRAALYARFHDVVARDTGTRFDAALQRRIARDPVAYITGTKEFWSLDFLVTADVLIPRPETEHAVEAVSELLARRRAPTVCDVGTGSGCIAIALARALPSATIVAVDLSPPALSVARQNAVRHGVASRVHLLASDLLTAIGASTRFDVIVSNPPYLAPGDIAAPELAREPRVALAAGPDGLAVVRRLLEAAPAHLAADGSMVMEFGAGQEAAVRHLAATAGFGSVAVQPDLAGLPRVLVATRHARFAT